MNSIGTEHKHKARCAGLTMITICFNTCMFYALFINVNELMRWQESRSVGAIIFELPVLWSQVCGLTGILRVRRYFSRSKPSAGNVPFPKVYPFIPLK